MAATSPSRLLKICVLSVIVTLCSGSYVITTPRKWVSGEGGQVCVFIVNNTAPEHFITVAVKRIGYHEELVGPITLIRIPEGKTELCAKIFVGGVINENALNLKVTGYLGGKEVDHKKTISLVRRVMKTFIQTDKYVYKPGQDVKFRILSVIGPYLNVSSDKYPEVWVETPSGSRVAQWTHVHNSGLVQLSMKLSDEPQQGRYKIVVRPHGGGEPATRTFKVEEYVLPRFDVTLTTPKFLLRSDTIFNVTVCAKYTYGQPVKGNLTLEIKKQGRKKSKITDIIEGKIFGCNDIEILAVSPETKEKFLKGKILYVSATVVENGTGEVFNVYKNITIHSTEITFTNVGNEYFLKPYLPFTGRVKAAFPDGSAAGGRRVEVCVHSCCQHLSTSPAGILKFIFHNVTVDNVKIETVDNVGDQLTWPRRYRMTDSSYTLSLKKYYSPSGSYLVIHAPEERLRCLGEHREHLITILFAANHQPRANFTVQVVSRGQIQFSRTSEHELSARDLPVDEEHVVGDCPPVTAPPTSHVRGFIQIPVTLPPTASPKAMVVVWYSRDDGEVVADAQQLNIDKCFHNQVNLAWSRSRAQPREQVSLRLSAEPKSLCSLGVVDRSVELLSSQQDDLTVDKVFELVEDFVATEYDRPQVDDTAYCRRIQGHWKRHTVSSSMPDGAGPGLVPYIPEGDDSPRDKRSLWWPSNPTKDVDALKMFDKSGLYFFSDLKTETRQCEEIYPSYALYRYDGNIDYLFAASDGDEPEVPPVFIVPPEAVSSTPRVYFPETWLWQLSTLPSSGVSSEELNMPDTITEWVGKAVCVHPEKGLGVSQAASITTFTPFFIHLTLPPSVKRGEILPVKISVFNYLEGALPVKVELEESVEYVILDGRGSQQAVGQHSSCIPPQDKVVYTVKIRPLALGEVNLTVAAYVDEVFPEVCGPEYVISKRDVIIKPIKVEAEGFLREETSTKYICSRDIDVNAESFEIWSLEPPAEIVKDSARGWVTAVGDLLGPTLKNLGSLVRMPYGCGEQNMLNFAPNIFILQYLEASNQTTPDIGNKAVEYMKQGYQRELNYRHEDGSYSVFGRYDSSGSTWLTAFVLKSFAQARQFIMIDENELDMSRTWLKKTQTNNTGCFDMVGKVLDKKMKGGIGSHSNPLPITAYVLISLLEAGEPSSSGAVTAAASCLMQDIPQDTYTLALKAYALALARLSEAEEAIQQLITGAVRDSQYMYWQHPSEAGKSKGVEVETAGYAVLAMMSLDSKRFYLEATEVVKWISSKRNGQGGFVSTQDTVVALQALASFESHHNQDTVDLVVTVTAQDLLHNFTIGGSNKLLQQMVHLPTIPSNVMLDMQGEGCALVQAVVRYNVPQDTPSEAFLLSVNTQTAPDPKCLTKNITACASYQLPDKTSNMAVIEVNLVSGYIPVKADLKQVVGDGRGLLKRYEVDGYTVTFYVDQLTQEHVCVSFRVVRELELEDLKPGTLTVYDYYQPELSLSKSYILPPSDECWE